MACTMVTKSSGLQARVERLLDVADVVALAEVLVDEAVDVAQLQFDGGTHVVEAHNLSVVTDDLQAALEIAQVIIRHFQYE